jgi:hypothetical protein
MALIPFLSTTILPTTRPPQSKMRFRLCNFWTDQDEWFYVCPRPSEEHLKAYFFGGGTDYYPESVEEAVKRVPGLIDEVMRQICDHAVPYFRKVAADRGKNQSTI